MAQVAILGSGPAGLMAALAVEHGGHTPYVYALGPKSQMFGAMYLHKPLPEVTVNPMGDFEIHVIKEGTREGYAFNVYGDRRAPCSWDDIPGGWTSAWDLGATYDRLWERYNAGIVPIDITPDVLGSILANYSYVLCTIPANRICARQHEHYFKFQDITIIHKPGKLETDENLIYYNGYEWDGTGREGITGYDWYRFSTIQGYQAWEYSRPQNEWVVGGQPEGEVSYGIKPLSTNCTCWTRYPYFARLGRFGRWQKGVLTHHAYEQAVEYCKAINAL